MEKDQIIKRLNEINTTLGHGDMCNPAHLKDGKLNIHTDHMSPKDIKELIILIGDWSFNKESEKKHDIKMERIKLEHELKNLLINQ